MRSRFLFPGDVILTHATTVELTIYRNHGETIGIHYKVAGDILSPFDDDQCEDDGDTLAADDASETAR